MTIYRELDSMPKHITQFAFKDMIENSVKLSIPNLDCVFFSCRIRVLEQIYTL